MTEIACLRFFTVILLNVKVECSALCRARFRHLTLAALALKLLSRNCALVMYLGLKSGILFRCVGVLCLVYSELTDLYLVHIAVSAEELVVEKLCVVALGLSALFLSLCLAALLCVLLDLSLKYCEHRGETLKEAENTAPCGAFLFAEEYDGVNGNGGNVKNYKTYRSDKLGYTEGEYTADKSAGGLSRVEIRGIKDGLCAPIGCRIVYRGNYKHRYE